MYTLIDRNEIVRVNYLSSYNLENKVQEIVSEK